jgi:CheY-like chemotaxis protein
MNLVVNACQAVHGREERWVRVEFEDQGDQVEFRVIDSGAGIALENRHRLMKPFFTTHGRAGMGLTISSRLISRVGGSLDYVDGVQNTCFRMRIPKAGAQAARKERLRFLVVEDSRTFGELLTMEIQELGHEVYWAKGISEAIEQMASQSFDLYFCDLHLDAPPVRPSSGVELIRYIRKSVSPDAVIFANTGLEVVDGNLVLKAGADFFDYKPITRGISTVIGEMIALLEKKRAAQLREKELQQAKLNSA